MQQEAYTPQKGYIVLFDPTTRTKQDRIQFMFNPASMVVSFSPNYNFKTAPVSRSSYAQYGNSEPMSIKFDLYLRGKFVGQNLALLKRLVDNAPLRDPFKNPPLCRLYLGNGLDWTTQGLLVDANSSNTPANQLSKAVPTGVIDSMEVTITKQMADLRPYEATVNLSFIESNVSALATNPNL